jgi:hypothetical protein
MKTAAEIVARAQAETDAGRSWRAKEILRGRIGSGPFDADVMDAYGLLLERMGDRFEAGKYLFLSGNRSPDRAPAIELFLRRQKGRHRADIWARLPTAVRAAPFESLPAVVQQELSELGVRKEAFGKKSRPAGPPMSFADRVKMVGALVVLAIFVASLVLGVGRLWSIAWDWLS